jgi:hypothetical protein
MAPLLLASAIVVHDPRKVHFPNKENITVATRVRRALFPAVS